MSDQLVVEKSSGADGAWSSESSLAMRGRYAKSFTCEKGKIEQTLREVGGSRAFRQSPLTSRARPLRRPGGFRSLSGVANIHDDPAALKALQGILTSCQRRGASSCPPRLAKPDAGTPSLTSCKLLHHPTDGSWTEGGSRAGASSQRPQCRRQLADYAKKQSGG